MSTSIQITVLRTTIIRNGGPDKVVLRIDAPNQFPGVFSDPACLNFECTSGTAEAWLSSIGLPVDETIDVSKMRKETQSEERK